MKSKVLAKSAINSVLNEAYRERLKRNAAYSKRAFAKSLGISASYLHEIETGAKILSPEKATLVASKLSLQVKATRRLELLCKLARSKKSHETADLQAQLEENDLLPDTDLVNVDEFEQFVSWKIYAFRSLLRVHEGHFDLEKFTHEMGISKIECEKIRSLLESAGEISRLPDGSYKLGDSHSLFWSKYQNKNVQKYIVEVLDLAKNAISTQDKYQRISGNATIAFSQSSLEEAWRVINECLLKLIKLSESTAQKDVVYQAAINFFQLTKPTSTPKKI